MNSRLKRIAAVILLLISTVGLIDARGGGRGGGGRGGGGMRGGGMRGGGMRGGGMRGGGMRGGGMRRGGVSRGRAGGINRGRSAGRNRVGTRNRAGNRGNRGRGGRGWNRGRGRGYGYGRGGWGWWGGAGALWLSAAALGLGWSIANNSLWYNGRPYEEYEESDPVTYQTIILPQLQQIEAEQENRPDRDAFANTDMVNTAAATRTVRTVPVR